VQNLGRIVVFLLFLAACGGDDVGVVASPGVETTIDGELSCGVSQVDGDLFLYNWPEYVDPALVDGFELEFDVEVIEDSYQSNEALFAKLQSGASYDLVVPSGYMVGRLVDGGLLQELKTEAIPNLSNLRARFSDPPYDPGGLHSVAYLWGTVGLGIAGDDGAFGSDASWAEVFDPGNVAGYNAGVSLLEDPRQVVGAALKYLGYSLNSTDPDELAEASNLIAGLDGLAVTFDSDDYTQRLAGGGVSVAHGYSDVLDSEGLGFATPSEGAAIWVNAMAVPANATHPCTAHTFLNHVLEAENGAALATWAGQASPNRAALPFVDPELLEDRSVYPGQDVDRRLEFIEDLGSFEDEYIRALAVARS